MLVLSRKTGESIVISGRITLTVNRVSGNRVTLAFDAPPAIHIRRSELAVFDNQIEDELDEAPKLFVSSDESGAACE
ncbi:MAG: carbon storage regulator [Planctomycetota bacterium]|nr:carbon storage regulator [Planctomycetota bacterium]